MPRLATICTALLTVALAATLTEWALNFSARRAPSEPIRPLVVGDPMARTQALDTAPIARLFGAAPAEASSVRLLGVIAQGAQGKGIALLAVDGQPALAVRAGEVISGDAVLAEVRSDRVLVTRSGATQEIRLPAKRPPEGITRVK
jgi:general secretion pathway protein C